MEGERSGQRSNLEVRLVLSVKGLDVWVIKRGEKLRRAPKSSVVRNWVGGCLLT